MEVKEKIQISSRFFKIYGRKILKNRLEIQNSSNQVIPAPKNYQRRQDDDQMEIDDEEDASKGYNQFMDNCETYFKEHEADFKPPARTGPTVAQSAPGAPPPSNPTTASTKVVSQSATGLPPRKESKQNL